VKRLIVGHFSWFYFPVMLWKVVLGVKFSHVKLGSYKKHVILLGVTCFVVIVGLILLNQDLSKQNI
jgi:hypothetical protein